MTKSKIITIAEKSLKWIWMIVLLLMMWEIATLHYRLNQAHELLKQSIDQTRQAYEARDLWHAAYETQWKALHENTK